MAASQDFQQAMRIGNIGEAIKTALSEAIELEITTWVVSADDGGIEQSDPQNALPGYRMTTRINIVDGDIENEIGSQFIGQGPYRELREFHLNQVKQGQEIIRRNLEAIKELFSFLLEARSPESTKQLGEGTGRSPASLPASVHPEVVEPVPTTDYAAFAPTEEPPPTSLEPPPIEKELAAPAGRLWGDASDAAIAPPVEPPLDMAEGMDALPFSAPPDDIAVDMPSGDSLDGTSSLIEPPAIESPIAPSVEPLAEQPLQQPLVEKEIPTSVENLWGDRSLESAAAADSITVNQLPDGAVSPEVATTPIEVGSFPVESVAFGAGDDDIAASTARLWGEESSTAAIAPDTPLSDTPATPDLSFFDQAASAIPGMPDAIGGLEGAIGSDLLDLPDLNVMGDLDAALSAIPDTPAAPPSPTESLFPEAGTESAIDFPADLFDETVEPEWEVFPPEAVTTEFTAPTPPADVVSSDTPAVDLAMFDNVATPDLSSLSEPELSGLDAFQDLLSPETTNFGGNLGADFTPPSLDTTPAPGITSDSLSALFGSDPPIGNADEVSTVSDFAWSAATMPTEAVTATESSTSIPKEFLDGDFLGGGESDESPDIADFPSDFGSGLSAEAEQALDNLFSPNQGVADELTDELSNALSDDFGDALLDDSDSDNDGLNWDEIVSDPLPNAAPNPVASATATPDASPDLDADSLAALFAEPPADGTLDSNPFDQADVADLGFELEDTGALGSDPLDALFGEPGDPSSPSELDLLMDLDAASGDDAEAGESDPFANFPVNLPTSGRGFGGGRQTPPANPKKQSDPNASEG